LQDNPPQATHKTWSAPGPECAFLPGCELTDQEEFSSLNLSDYIIKTYITPAFGDRIAFYPPRRIPRANRIAGCGRFWLTCVLLDLYNGLSEY
jgi:hypothetical protein